MSNVGRMIYGFCNGAFGRDSYDNKRIEAEGWDWIVVRSDDATPDFTAFIDNDDKQRSVDQWATHKETEV